MVRMKVLYAWAEAAFQRVMDFAEPNPEDVYLRCVLRSADGQEVTRLLEKREGVTRSAVIQTMHQSAYRAFVRARCEGGSEERRYDRALRARYELGLSQAAHMREAGGGWWGVCLAAILLPYLALNHGGLIGLAVLAVSSTVLLTALSVCGIRAWTRVWHSLRVGGCLFRRAVQRGELGLLAGYWGQEQQLVGTDPVVASAVRHLLGEDADSLFIPDAVEGLRAPRAPDYFVESAAVRHLVGKLRNMQDGTIAVCGPRGVGKSTLLEHCVKRADFGVLVQAPATYTPQDFLVTLSVRLCERYMVSQGHPAPALSRLSSLGRWLRKVRTRLARFARWTVFAVPALALLTLGLSAPVRTLYTQYGTRMWHALQDQSTGWYAQLESVWDGRSVVFAVVSVLIGTAWWMARKSSPLPAISGFAFRQFVSLSGTLLMVSCAISFLGDPGVMRRLIEPHPPLSLFFSSGLYVPVFLWLLLRKLREAGTVTVGKRHFPVGTLATMFATPCGLWALFRLVELPQMYGVLADEQNPLRLAGIVVGSLLSKVEGWRRKDKEGPLVTRCRDYLYRLQTLQSSTKGLTSGGALAGLTLGSTHASTLSTLPPSFPELVDGFRELLGAIADEKAQKRQRVVIAIDEVDRLGSETQALAFLSEVKAVLGVPHVHFLISVAEDVGATFVRRGLPHQGVTDSSFDDIVHVQPGTFAETAKVLTARSTNLTEPYAMLAHALSGGVLRDVLRYGLQIMEQQEKAQSFELTQISRHLVREELAETLSGFRTLLGGHQWSSGNSQVLTALHALTSGLRDPCACTETLLDGALADLAHLAPTASEIPDEARQVVDEASAYTYFALTLLDIFGEENFEARRRDAADNGLDGYPQRLAEARQELGISPHSARPLIDAVRNAWSLPLEPGTSPRRFRHCTAHPQPQGDPRPDHL
ncbi:hypothetical protein ACH4SP_42140 [Streptomyces sp. NPDC021093]|uniref:hypothetical protein n=1 Tax=Streptomyces sp. NPDC021093 TaxID=3365112 RepID=UPI0037A345FA